MEYCRNYPELQHFAHGVRDEALPIFFGGMMAVDGLDLLKVAGIQSLQQVALNDLIAHLLEDADPDPTAFVPPFVKSGDLSSVGVVDFLKGVLRGERSDLVLGQCSGSSNLGLRSDLNLGAAGLAKLIRDEGSWTWFHNANGVEVEGASYSVVDSNLIRVAHMFSLPKFDGAPKAFVSASFDVKGTTLSPRTEFLLVKLLSGRVAASCVAVDIGCFKVQF